MVGPTLWRLLIEDTGQDLVEYGLLAGILGALGVLLFPEIADKMRGAYLAWVSGSQAVWEPCPPAPAACP